MNCAKEIQRESCKLTPSGEQMERHSAWPRSSSISEPYIGCRGGHTWKQKEKTEAWKTNPGNSTHLWLPKRFFMFSKKIIKNLILFWLISKKIFQAQIKIAMKFSDFETKNQMVSLVDKIFNTRYKTQVSYAD